MFVFSKLHTSAPTFHKMRPLFSDLPLFID